MALSKVKRLPLGIALVYHNFSKIQKRPYFHLFSAIFTYFLTQFPRPPFCYIRILEIPIQKNTQPHKLITDVSSQLSVVNCQLAP